MRFAKSVAAALIVASSSFALMAPASSAPRPVQSGLSNAGTISAEPVQYRRYGPRYGYRGGYGGRRGYGGGAVLGGLAAGAIIGGAIASSQANAAAEQNSAYCAQRFRSYDPESGTYLNSDGNRYPCP